MASARALVFIAALSLGWLVGTPGVAAATDAEEEPPRAPRTHNLALSLAVQAPLDVPDKLGLGGGANYIREYFVSERFGLGIDLGLRVFPDAPAHLAFGYGLTLRHFFADSTARSGPRSGLFFLYGLLMQLNWLADRDGTSTGHDTWLSVGYDWKPDRSEAHLFVQLGYHLTQLRRFDQPTVWWPYTEVLIGTTWE